MKKALMTITTMALLGAAAPQANAHGGGAIAAGVVGGLGAGLIIGSALRPAPVYAATPVYYPAPAPVVVQQPAQQIVVQQPTDQQIVVQQPVQTVQQPVVVQQQPVVVQSPPVVYAPAPVYYPAPVYVRPYYAPPVVTFGFSFGHGGYGHGGYYHRGYQH